MISGKNGKRGREYGEKKVEREDFLRAVGCQLSLYHEAYIR